MLTIQQAYKCRSQNFAVKTHDGHIADLTGVHLTANTVDLHLYNEDGYKTVDESGLTAWRKCVDPATLEVVPRIDGDGRPYYPTF